MHIGVTGATGHIGNNLVRQLIDEGHLVRVFVHRKPEIFDGLPVEPAYGDLLDKDSVDTFAEGLDVVYHLAAKIFINGKQQKENYRQNVEGTRHVLESIKRKGVKRLIHFSSIHAYDPFPQDQPLDESRPLVLEDHYLYNRSKAVTQEMVMKAFRNGINGVILNPTAVIGPNDFKPSLLGQAVLKMVKGKLPALIPGGYDWVDVRDITKAAVRALTAGCQGEAYILSGHWQSLAGLYRVICSQRGIKHKLPVLPSWIARIGAPFMAVCSAIKDVEPLYTQGSITFLKRSNRLISHEKAGRDLDYSPRPFEETVTDTLKWFEQMKWL